MFVDVRTLPGKTKLTAIFYKDDPGISNGKVLIIYCNFWGSIGLFSKFATWPQNTKLICCLAEIYLQE